MQDEIPLEYLNNENPFAYMKNYPSNPFLDPNVKPRLDALQQMQPKFIPIGIDDNTLRTEQIAKTTEVVENHISGLLKQGLKLINHDESGSESILRGHLDTPGVIDVLIEIHRLRLLNNQKRLREKVYCALKNTIPQNIISTMDYSLSITEDYLADAIEYERLEKSMSTSQ